MMCMQELATGGASESFSHLPPRLKAVFGVFELPVIQFKDQIIKIRVSPTGLTLIFHLNVIRCRNRKLNFKV